MKIELTGNGTCLVQRCALTHLQIEYAVSARELIRSLLERMEDTWAECEIVPFGASHDIRIYVIGESTVFEFTERR